MTEREGLFIIAFGDDFTLRVRSRSYVATLYERSSFRT